jgi:hypothetical protein
MATDPGLPLGQLLATLADTIAAIAPSGSVVVDADGRTIAANESGSIYSNEGAVAIAPFVLPGAALNLEFGFYVQDADGIRVTAAAGDTLRIGASVSAAAGKVESTTIGSVVKFKAVNATEWVALISSGTWVVT